MAYKLNTRKVLPDFELPFVLCLMLLCGRCFSLTITFTTSNGGFSQNGNSEWTVGTPSLAGLILAENFDISGFPSIRVTYGNSAGEFINCLFSLASNACDKIAGQCTEATNYSITCTLSGNQLTVNMAMDTLNLSQNSSHIRMVQTTSGLITDWVNQDWTITLRYCNTSAIGNIQESGTGNAVYGDTVEFSCLSGYTPNTINATCTSNFNTWTTTNNCTEQTTTTAAMATSNGIVATNSGSTQGNNIGTTSDSDSSSDRSTMSSITTEAVRGPVTNSPELSPGAIAGIVIGTVVGVSLILFLIWWFSEAFRSCLHDISDCFPEDHCCGKEYSKGSSS